MTPKMTIQSQRTRIIHNGIRRVDDGGSKVVIYGQFVKVQVFTYPGGRHGDAFTRLDCYIGGFEYWCQLPRHYHDRWLLRLAGQFESQCWQDAKKKGYL